MSSRTADNTLAWQAGIAQKLAQVLANFSNTTLNPNNKTPNPYYAGLRQFVASIAIGFNSNWRRALLVLSLFPAITLIMAFLKVLIGSKPQTLNSKPSALNLKP